MSKVNKEQGELSSWGLGQLGILESVGKECTFLIPLWRVHIESAKSTLSPMVTGKEEDLAMAKAAADLRKSMDAFAA